MCGEFIRPVAFPAGEVMPRVTTWGSSRASVYLYNILSINNNELC